MTSKLLPMLRTDVAGKLVEWNDQLAELTGIPSREVLGEPLVSHVLPSSHTRVQQMLSRALQGHVEKSVHVRLRCRVGVQLALSVGASCHYSLAGDVLGVVVVGQPPAPEDSVPAPPVADDVGDSSAQLVLDCAGVAMARRRALPRVARRVPPRASRPAPPRPAASRALPRAPPRALRAALHAAPPSTPRLPRHAHANLPRAPAPSPLPPAPPPPTTP